MQRIRKFTLPLAVAALTLTATAQQQRSQNEREQQQPEQQRQQLTQEQKNQQSTFQPKEIPESELKKSVSAINKASSFMGMPVQNLENQKLGEVNDLVFDPASGKISYAVLSVGGFLGIGDKLVAVPITALKARPGQEHLVLDMNKQQLTSAPGLAKDNWPDLNAVGAPAGSEQETGESATESNTLDQGASPRFESETESKQPDIKTETEIEAEHPADADASIQTDVTVDRPTDPEAQGAAATSETGSESEQSNAVEKHELEIETPEP